MLLVSAPGLLRRIGAIDIEHLADRFGTLVIIALGESVLAIVVAVSAAPTSLSAAVAVLSFVITAGLAWAMFMFGVDAMRAGLEELVARGDARGVVETVAFLPFVLVAGVMMLASAVSVAIQHPDSALPPAAAAALGGGVALFLRHERHDLAPVRHPVADRTAVGGAGGHPAARRRSRRSCGPRRLGSGGYGGDRARHRDALGGPRQNPGEGQELSAALTRRWAGRLPDPLLGGS